LATISHEGTVIKDFLENIPKTRYEKFASGFRINPITYPMIKMVEVSCSSFIHLVSCNEKARRKKRLQIKAIRDSFKSQVIS
jgi:hypothetical protein